MRIGGDIEIEGLGEWRRQEGREKVAREKLKYECVEWWYGME